MPLVVTHGDPAELAALGDDDRARLDRPARAQAELSGYAAVQATRPQTLAYALTDSPVGQLAWIVEKFNEWTDSADVPEQAVVVVRPSVRGGFGREYVFDVVAVFAHAGFAPFLVAAVRLAGAVAVGGQFDVGMSGGVGDVGGVPFADPGGDGRRGVAHGEVVAFGHNLLMGRPEQSLPAALQA